MTEPKTNPQQRAELRKALENEPTYTRSVTSDVIDLLNDLDAAEAALAERVETITELREEQKEAERLHKYVRGIPTR